MHGEAEESTQAFRGNLGLGSGCLMSRLPHFRHLGTVSENAKHPAAHVGVDFHQPHLVSQAGLWC